MKNQASADLDSIIREIDGYGDLVAASIVHDVSIHALKSRLRESYE
ncbi:MAG: hypothetical protein GKC10_09625 [Methanosarcinales archaeon]|nr:hypothetical protein [Methanosarcinales archaeon]